MWTFGAIVQYFSDIGIFLTFDPWFVDNCGHKIRVSIILKTTAPPQKGTPANRTSIHTGISLNDYNKEIASLHISPRKVQKTVHSIWWCYLLLWEDRSRWKCHYLKGLNVRRSDKRGKLGTNGIGKLTTLIKHHQKNIPRYLPRYSPWLVLSSLAFKCWDRRRWSKGIVQLK